MRQPTLTRGGSSSSRYAPIAALLLLIANLCQFGYLSIESGHYAREVTIWTRAVEACHDALVKADDRLVLQEEQLTRHDSAAALQRVRFDALEARVALAESSLQSAANELTLLATQLDERDATIVALRQQLVDAEQRGETQSDVLRKELSIARQTESDVRVSLDAERRTAGARADELAAMRAQLAPLQTELQFLRGELKKLHKYRFADEAGAPRAAAQQYAVDIEHKEQKRAEFEERKAQSASDAARAQLRRDGDGSDVALASGGELSSTDPDAVALYAEFTRRQRGAATCAGRRAIVFSFQSFGRYGFATALHHVSLALLYARDTNRTLVMRKPDQWIYASPACADGFECYFGNVSSCTEATIGGETPRGSLHAGNVDDAVVLYTSAGVTYDVVSRQGAQYRTLWWRAHTMRWLLRPHDAFLEHIDAFRAENRWPGGGGAVIGMHVRHGDKKEEVARLHETKEYLDVALRLRSSNPDLHTIFLSSDDAAVIQQATTEGARLGFRVIHRQETRTNAAVHSLLTQGLADPLEQGGAALENIWLLSLCDELIGTFSSSFFKLAYELRHARTGSTEAHSLDLVRWQA
jgi:hypothetical protein